MSDQPKETALQRADTFSAILPVAGIVFVIAAVFGFLAAGWGVGLCLLALALIFFSLGAILDLLMEIAYRLKRLEPKNDQKADKQ
jgi:hypothetical protein